MALPSLLPWAPPPSLPPTPLRVTTEGCPCRKEWSNSNVLVTDYCGNPDNDVDEWCFVVTIGCQGRSWGYCAPLALDLPLPPQRPPPPPRVLSSPPPAPPSGTPLPSVVRITVEGCECQRDWQSPGGTWVTNYCGDPDGEGGGDWCYVTARSCQSRDWGYCGVATPQASRRAHHTWDGCSAAQLRGGPCLVVVNDCCSAKGRPSSGQL